MKRSWKTMKLLMERFEDESLPDYLNEVNDAPDYEIDPQDREEAIRRRDLVFGHLLLLQDSNLVAGVVTVKRLHGGKWGFNLNAPRLTMSGHDTLGALRSDPVWRLVSKKAAEASVPITLELIKAGLKALI